MWSSVSDATRIGVQFLNPIKRVGLFFRRIFHLLARPVPGREGAVIHAFRGYAVPPGGRSSSSGAEDQGQTAGISDKRDAEAHDGGPKNPGKAFLVGRVLHQPFSAATGPSGKLGRDLLGVVRRALRWGARGVEVDIEFGGASTRVVTGAEGYFEAVFDLDRSPAERSGLTEASLRVVGSPDSEAGSQIYVAPSDAPFVVISDIDDTVVHTGVARKLAMLWNTFMEGAESRVAFPGVAAFYRALHRGPSGRDRNPMVYVSRGPWSIYEVLMAFLRVHGFPEDPVLFLRDWGMTLRHPLPRSGRGHKERMVRRIVEDFADRPFVLIGDSGQGDPEIYAEVVKENPGRVLAVYIRNVTRTPERDKAIRRLAEESARAGTHLMLADDSFQMARDAVERGLISPDALPEVLREESGKDARTAFRPSGR